MPVAWGQAVPRGQPPSAAMLSEAKIPTSLDITPGLVQPEAVVVAHERSPSTSDARLVDTVPAF